MAEAMHADSAAADSDPIAPGTKRMIEGRLRVYYDGYWIQAYDAPADTLAAKKWLIEALARRLFNHVEHGLNVPGSRLEEARRVFETETDPQRRRVKGAMLAGAHFNRATDVFTKLVELQALGVRIESDNALMRQCGEHLKEAITLGKLVLHRSGEEGLDELWGEPFKAFAFPIEDFYNSRYIKIAQTMRAIDRMADAMIGTIGAQPAFAGVEGPILEFARAAKLKSETLRTDSEIFEVWTSFVVQAEKLSAFEPALPANPTPADEQLRSQGLALICAGKDLISYVTRARVPMPKSTQDFIDRCEHFAAACAGSPPASALVPAQGGAVRGETAPRAAALGESRFHS